MDGIDLTIPVSPQMILTIHNNNPGVLLVLLSALAGCDVNIKDMIIIGSKLREQQTFENEGYINTYYPTNYYIDKNKVKVNELLMRGEGILENNSEINT